MGTNREAENLIFVGGVGRSGTTYLRVLLNRHPDIWISDESNFILKLMRIADGEGHLSAAKKNQVLSLLYGEQKFSDWKISESRLENTLASCLPADLETVTRAILRLDRDEKRQRAQVIGIKKGSYLRDPFQLIRWIPCAKFVHIVRDGRAVYNSRRKARHSESGEYFEMDPVSASRYWRNRIELFDRFKASFPDRSHEITYESLVEDPQSELDGIFRFAGVDTGIDVLPADEPAATVSVPQIRKHLHRNVGRSPQLSRIEAWRTELPAKELRLFESNAYRILERKGYRVTMNPSQRIWMRIMSCMRKA